MGNILPATSRSHDRRRHRRSDSRSSSKFNDKVESEVECSQEVQIVYKRYKGQRNKKGLEAELQVTRQQLDRTKAELTNRTKELGELRCEFDDVKRDLNREVLMFETGFNQLSSAIERLVDLPKNNKTAKEAKWRIRLDCQSINLAPVPAAQITVKMINFSLLRQKYEWFNHFFFSHDNGYKLCLRVFPSGYEDAREKSMSVFIQHMNGPYDGNLQWPMKGSIVIELLNQVKDKHHYSRTIQYNDNVDETEICAGQVISEEANQIGEPYFISYDDLFQTTAKIQFFRDDCVYFRISYRI